jgi:hypothetical protein
MILLFITPWIRKVVGEFQHNLHPFKSPFYARIGLGSRWQTRQDRPGLRRMTLENIASRDFNEDLCHCQSEARQRTQNTLWALGRTDVH